MNRLLQNGHLKLLFCFIALQSFIFPFAFSFHSFKYYMKSPQIVYLCSPWPPHKIWSPLQLLGPPIDAGGTLGMVLFSPPPPTDDRPIASPHQHLSAETDAEACGEFLSRISTLEHVSPIDINKLASTFSRLGHSVAIGDICWRWRWSSCFRGSSDLFIFGPLDLEPSCSNTKATSPQ